MKKLIVLLVCAVTLMSCSIDEGVNTQVEYGKVSAIDLPDFFELGETYQIEVTYLLPTACHSGAGVDVFRMNEDTSESWDIFIAGVTTYDANAGECTRDNSAAERKETFSLRIEEDVIYKFHLWTGVSSTNQPEYTIIEVPVGAPSEGEEEEEEETEN